MRRTKIKMMTDKPDMTEEEIRDSMNFDQVLTLAQASILNKKYRAHRIWTCLYLAGIVVIGLIGYQQLRQIGPKKNPVESSPAGIPASPSESSKDSTSISNHVEVKESGKEQAKVTAKKIEPRTATARAKTSADSAASAYFAAEPTDGFPLLYEYFNRELKYPQEAIKDSIQGVITVSFIINSQGQPKEFKIINSLGSPFDKEVVRLIENMPPWKPAMLNGKPIDSKISIPLTFQIKTVRQPR
jgi:TonB family protein